MDSITKLLRKLTTIMSVYFVLVAVMMGWPTTAWVVIVVGMARATRRQMRRLTTLGSARWAKKSDLEQLGMLDSNSGLNLGRLIEP